MPCEPVDSTQKKHFQENLEISVEFSAARARSPAFQLDVTGRDEPWRCPTGPRGPNGPVTTTSCDRWMRREGYLFSDREKSSYRAFPISLRTKPSSMLIIINARCKSSRHGRNSMAHRTSLRSQTNQTPPPGLWGETHKADGKFILFSHSKNETPIIRSSYQFLV